MRTSPAFPRGGGRACPVAGCLRVELGHGASQGGAAFAAFIIMQLVEEGRLDLDRPVEDFGINLPEVRVRHLLTHTSDSRPPGSAYHYNGDRYALLSGFVTGNTPLP